jgi:hypothetical protein
MCSIEDIYVRWQETSYDISSNSSRVVLHYHLCWNKFALVQFAGNVTAYWYQHEHEQVDDFFKVIFGSRNNVVELLLSVQDLWFQEVIDQLPLIEEMGCLQDAKWDVHSLDNVEFQKVWCVD